MISLGETLRSERVRRNLTLDSISHELKISARLLEAIEQERFERLPGGVFTRSFVRQYAHFLGLDEEEALGELQRALEPPVPVAQLSESRRPETGIPLPRVQGWEAVGDQRSRWSASLPQFLLLILVMVVCSGVYYWWQRVGPLDRPGQIHPAAAQKLPAPQPPPSAPAPSPNSASEATPTHAASPASPGTAGPEHQAPAVVAADPRQRIQPEGSTGSEHQAQATAPVAPEPNPAAAVRVQITAEEPVWVSARADGKSSFSGTLRSNETRTVDANSAVVLRLGNAGGIKIVLNGKPIDSVGPKGQIRTVQLTSGGFKIVPNEPLNAPDLF